MAAKSIDIEGSENESAAAAAPAKERRARPRPDTGPKPLPPYAVILHNDSVNGFDFVVRTLRKVFRYGTAKAFWLTLKAHVSGRSVVWSGSLEVAELKAEQLRSVGPDPLMMHRGARRLTVTAERMAG